MADLSQTPAARRLRQFRADNPEYTERNRKRAGARQRALEALAREHPEEFAGLYEAEHQDTPAPPECR